MLKPRAQSHRNEKPSRRVESSPPSLQPEKACTVTETQHSQENKHKPAKCLEEEPAGAVGILLLLVAGMCVNTDLGASLTKPLPAWTPLLSLRPQNPVLVGSGQSYS